MGNRIYYKSVTRHKAPDLEGRKGWKPMEKKNIIKTDAERSAANEKRIATMRANLSALESKAENILCKGAENITRAEKKTLLSLLNIAYHDSGKIETIANVKQSILNSPRISLITKT